MPTPTLAIVGASCRAAAQSAIRAGYRPLTADRFADADLAAICDATLVHDYPQALPAWLAGVTCHGWLYVGRLENYPSLVARMAQLRPLLGNDAETLRAVRDPWRLARALNEASLPFPEIKANDPHWRETGWLRKNPTGRPRGIQLANATPTAHDPTTHDEVAASAPRGHAVDGEPAVLQRIIDGQPASAIFVGNGQHAALLGITRQLVGEAWLAAPQWQYCGTMGPLPIAERLEQQIQRIGQTLTQVFRLRGLFGVDLILAGEKAWTIEVNPRYTAAVEVLERATGVIALACHVEACRNARLPIPTVPRGTEENAAAKATEKSTPASTIVGKAILFANQATRITVAQFDRWQTMTGCGHDPSLADIPLPGTLIEPGCPVLTALVGGTDFEQVEQNLRTVMGEVRSDLLRQI
jgi:predicted ATP-grasp superfamily ATP-dependent carboligase